MKDGCTWKSTRKLLPQPLSLAHSHTLTLSPSLSLSLTLPALSNSRTCSAHHVHFFCRGGTSMKCGFLLSVSSLLFCCCCGCRRCSERKTAGLCVMHSFVLDARLLYPLNELYSLVPWLFACLDLHTAGGAAQAGSGNLNANFGASPVRVNVCGWMGVGQAGIALEVWRCAASWRWFFMVAGSSLRVLIGSHGCCVWGCRVGLQWRSST